MSVLETGNFDVEGSLWIAGALFGLFMGAAFGVIFGLALKRMDAGIGPGTDLARLRAARRALQRGEPSGDSETDRIAGGLAQGALRLPIRPRFNAIVATCGALLHVSMLVVAVMEEDTPQTVFFGVAAVMFVVMAAASHPIQKGALRRSERIAAMYGETETRTR